MSAVSLVQGAADRKASLERRPAPANSATKRAGGGWVGIRSLLAELAAFPVRIMRIDNKQVVIADLPGLKKEEVRVELTDSVLVIEAEPNREWEPFFRRAGRRVIPLPDGARIHRAKAQLKNGVLTVSVPVWNAREGRRVSVEEVLDIEPQQPDCRQAARKPVSPISDEKYAAQ